MTANLLLSYVNVTLYCDRGLVYSCPDGSMISIVTLHMHVSTDRKSYKSLLKDTPPLASLIPLMMRYVYRACVLDAQHGHALTGAA